MFERIAVVKTAWSDDYAGEMPKGRHANIRKLGDAYERYNFQKGPRGRYYGYLPPMGEKERPPQAAETTGWLLVFVAAQNGTGPLVVVGWYEDATLHDEYLKRPEYAEPRGFPTDIHGAPYSYCLTARRVHLIPSGERIYRIAGDHIRRAPIVYLRGGPGTDPWRAALARELEILISGRAKKREKPSPGLNFPDVKHRKLVERAAVDAVEQLLKRTHEIENREKDKCGYDLRALHRSSGEEWFVEVKGTSGAEGHFYMTRNEKSFVDDPRWRLAMVTDALGKPRIQILDGKKAQKTFFFNPFAWEGVLKVRS
jgi:hypothetical protein